MSVTISISVIHKIKSVQLTSEFAKAAKESLGADITLEDQGREHERTSPHVARQHVRTLFDCSMCQSRERRKYRL